MKKLSIREIIDILIKVDGIGYQKLHLIDASNGYHHEIGIRYDLPGDEHPYSTTKWKHINGIWVPRYIECFIPEPTQIREMEKYAIPGNNLFLLPERVVNEIIHQYRFEFWPATINRMKIRNIYRELWDIPTYIHYGSTQFDPKKKFPIRNDSWTKPRGGFWASRVDATFG